MSQSEDFRWECNEHFASVRDLSALTLHQCLECSFYFGLFWDIKLRSENFSPPSPQSCCILRELSALLVSALSALCEVVLAMQLSKWAKTDRHWCKTKGLDACGFDSCRADHYWDKLKGDCKWALQRQCSLQTFDSTAMNRGKLWHVTGWIVTEPEKAPQMLPVSENSHCSLIFEVNYCRRFMSYHQEGAKIYISHFTFTKYNNDFKIQISTPQLQFLMEHFSSSFFSSWKHFFLSLCSSYHQLSRPLNGRHMPHEQNILQWDQQQQQ